MIKVLGDLKFSFNFRGMANGGLGWKRLGLAWGRRRMLVSVLKFEVF